MEHPANLVVSSRYDGCTMVQPYIKCTNTYCFTYKYLTTETGRLTASPFHVLSDNELSVS